MGYKRTSAKVKPVPAGKATRSLSGMENTIMREPQDGPVRSSTKSAPKGTMGVTSKSSGGRISQGGDPGGSAAGRARTNRGKNSTGSGPQGMRG